MSQSPVPPGPGETHAVFNQPLPLVDVNLYATDAALIEAAEREGAHGMANELAAFGAEIGRAAWFEDGDRANRLAPRIRNA